jgi:hypothetical protein
MKIRIKDLRDLVVKRICIICGKPVPEKKGILHLRFRVVTHIDGCSDKLREISKDRSKSPRGKHRPLAEILDHITWMN